MKKKIVLFALFLAAAATSAFAHTEPQPKVFLCYYYGNYTGVKNPGLSWWEKRIGSTELFYTIEHFQRPNGTWEGYQAKWSNPTTDSYGFTNWNFHFAKGTFCSNVLVTPGGYTVSFNGCSDGSSRWCSTE